MSRPQPDSGTPDPQARPAGPDALRGADTRAPEHCAGQELLPLEMADPAPPPEPVEEPPAGPPPLLELAPPPDRANRVNACIVHDGLLLVVARDAGDADENDAEPDDVDPDGADPGLEAMGYGVPGPDRAEAEVVGLDPVGGEAVGPDRGAAEGRSLDSAGRDRAGRYDTGLRDTDLVDDGLDDEDRDDEVRAGESAQAVRGWTLPGGAVRRGESRRHAAARLVRETTWVRVEAGARGVTVTGTTGARMSCFPGLLLVQADPLAPGAAWIDPDEAPWAQDAQIAQLREHGLLETLLV